MSLVLRVMMGKGIQFYYYYPFAAELCATTECSGVVLTKVTSFDYDPGICSQMVTVRVVVSQSGFNIMLYLLYRAKEY